MTSSVNKNDSIILENNSAEKFDNIKIKKPTEFISSLNFDKIKNIDNLNENVIKTDNNKKLGNESNDHPFISVPLVPKFYSSGDVNELIKNKDESFYEHYHKYQDFIFHFRLLLIFYFLNKKNCQD